MGEKITNFNPLMLTWAREQSMVDINSLEKDFAQKIQQWESSAGLPTFVELKKLAHLYRKPVAIFFFPEPPQIKDIKLSCRTLNSEIYSTLSVNIAKMMDYARYMQINLYELHSDSNKSIIRFKWFKENLSQLSALQIRDFLGVPLQTQKKNITQQEMFNIWRDAFYNIGIYVYKQAFGDDTISGLCIDDLEFPVILINNSTSLTRQCFTLLHELYHLLNETSGIDFRNDNAMEHFFKEDERQIEFDCNNFAANILVPSNDFKTELQSKSLTYDLIEQLAMKYKVSREVINRKLYDFEYIDFQTFSANAEIFVADYFRAKAYSTENDSRGNYYNTITTYLGIQYLSEVYQKYYAHQISINKLTQFLNMSISNASSLAERKGWGAL